MAAMQMTRVASRRVIQIASIVGILFGVIGAALPPLFPAPF
jgi:xanthine/uracil permease